MRRERRQPTKAEWAQLTSSRSVVRRIPPGLPARRGEQLFGASRHETQAPFLRRVSLISV
jgi:hypothetical protein